MCWYTTFTEVQQGSVKVGDGVHLPVKGVGTVRVAGAFGAQLEFHNVLFVPGLAANLLSMHRVHPDGYKVQVAEHTAMLYQGSESVALARVTNGLYVFGDWSMQAHALFTAAEYKKQLWHRRLGHLNFHGVQRMQDVIQATDATPGDLAAPTSEVCGACAMGKQHRPSFPRSDHKTSRPLELLHMDLVGELEEESLGGAKYFCAFYDDYSTLSVVRFVKHKSDVPAAVIEVITLLEQQTGLKLQRARTDRGSEYINATVQAFFAAKGITQEPVPPYT